MKFSEMKLQANNGVKLYFKRNWNREDLMNLDEIPEEVHRTLKQVYFTLLCAMLCSTFGSLMQFISVAGGRLTVLSYVASLIWFFFTPPGRLNVRFLLLMLVAYSFGASFSAFSYYLFKIKQRERLVDWYISLSLVISLYPCYVLGLLAGTTIGIGNFLYRALITTERREIYIGCLKYCYVLLISGTAFILLDRALWMITILFMGYLVIYSQEILYYANIGDIHLINCTFSAFFHLPGIVIHAARVYQQGAEIEQHEHN